MRKINLWKIQLVFVGLALLLFCASGCDSAITPTSVPHPAPSLVPDDDPTTGAMVRSTRQAQATVTRQAQMNEEATQVAVQATQTTEARADATATVAQTAALSSLRKPIGRCSLANRLQTISWVGRWVSNKIIRWR
jgi:hypothetical protein